MIQLRNICKSYFIKKGSDVNAIKGISLDFSDKGLVFITGKSGCGKTTLLNLIGGLDKPDSGELIVQNRSSNTFTASDFDNYRNTYVGLVFQDYNLIDNYTVGENIGLALEMQGKVAQREKIDEIMRQVDLVDEKTGETFYNREINELSGGQKQRVAIARAIIKMPKILLADEPTGALDSSTGRQIYKLLKKLSEKMLVIVVSHDIESAELYGDRIIELKDGLIINDSKESLNNTEKESCNKCIFVKGKLPFKRIFTMGISGLKVKKFKLAISIVLSVITFFIFGFSLAAAFSNPLNTELEQLYQNGQKQIILYNNIAREDDMDSVISFTESQINKIVDYCGEIPPFVHSMDFYGSTPMALMSMGYNIGVKDYYDFSTSRYGRYEQLAATIHGLVEVDANTGEQQANIRPDERFIDLKKCRLPETFDEIAITDMQADIFMKYGYIEKRNEDNEFEDEDLIKINTPDDLIGKILGTWDAENEVWIGRTYKIVGVYSTEQNKDELRSVLNDPQYKGASRFYEDYVSGLSISAERTIISYAYVKQGLFDSFMEDEFYQKPIYEKNRNACYLISLKGNVYQDADFINSLNITENGQEYRVGIHTSYTGFISNSTFMITWMVRVGLVIAIVFIIFATLLMISFINASTDSKKNTIGILRSMGAKKSDIAKICLVENLSIMIIQLIISLVITATICNILNKFLFYVPILQFGIIPIFIIISICLGVNSIITLLNVLGVVKKKPVDILNNSK